MPYRIRTSHSDIVLANLQLCKRLPNLIDERPINVYAFSRICWACGVELPGLTARCHIVANSKGGQDVPTNYFLLCEACHEDQPDAASRESQEHWLLHRPSWVENYLPIAKECVARLVSEFGVETIERYSAQDFVETLCQGYRASASWSNATRRRNAYYALRELLSATARSQECTHSHRMVRPQV